MREWRRAESARIRTPHLEERHTSACRVLPTREALLDALPKGGTIAELGVAFGDFSAQILTRAEPRELHLVDMWEADRYKSGRLQVQERFGEEIAAGRVKLHIGKSTDCLAQFPDKAFDFIYIDTNHGYDTTIAELRLSAPKMRDGGLLAGHDYCTGNIVEPVLYGVIQACHRFCLEAGWRYEFLTLDAGGSFSFALGRGG
jgi:predicted O-methyltransferase YrrM